MPHYDVPCFYHRTISYYPILTQKPYFFRILSELFELVIIFGYF